MLNAAIVGLGWWGKTILRTLDGSGALRVVRAVDVSPDGAAVAAAHGVPFADSLAAALADPAVEAVILCTPHSLHRAQVEAVAAAGRHVFCEKPLSLTRADAERCVAACRAAGVVLAVGHERRFEPPMLALREMVAAGALGTLLQLEANFSQNLFLSMPSDNWRLSAAEAPAGPMTATGIHLLDLAVSFLGPAESALASVRQLGSHLVNGDTLGALIRFRSGANALLGAILATPFAGRFALYGNRGWVEIRDKSHPQDSQGWTLTRCLAGGPIESLDYPAASAVRANLEAFAAACRGGPAYPVPPEQMIWNIAALEAIARSSASGAIETVG